jgi:hypothetical protein
MTTRSGSSLALSQVTRIHPEAQRPLPETSVLGVVLIEPSGGLARSAGV